ncbi:MAG TPA: pseudouridine-5'-phosphate glycosidase [Pseudonocardia sp.]|nr:pseudouridine-5'-phosphate glycosidase [Pseudonocardia sp.]
MAYRPSTTTAEPDREPVLNPVLSPEVADAIDGGRPVVALESTLLAHGLPAPDNHAVALELERLVRDAGAVPATVAVLDGVARVGLTAPELSRVCAGGMAKLSRRDLGVAVGLGLDGATTVASTAALAHAAGIEVFATGGLGGVHRGARESWDVSADLGVLATVPIVVVCSGVKSILDVAATLEQLETLSVPVLGYGTNAFPGFYRRDSGCPSPWRVDGADRVADVAAAHLRLGGGAGIVVANPVPLADELDAELHDRVLAEGLALVRERGIRGRDVTPALLEHFHTATERASLSCNIALVKSNAALAAKVALELRARRGNR